MRKLLSSLALLMFAATLAGCGGSDNAFVTPGSSGATTLSVAKLVVTSSAATLPPDGSTVTITVTATDQNNVAVDGAAVTFATSAGTLAVTSGTTSAAGQATATLAAQGIAAGTVITITANSGSVSGKTTVTVASTQQTLTLSTSVPQIPSAAGAAPATIKALLVDANNNVISGATVDFQATSGALIVTQGTTDATGTAIATLSAGTSAQNRVITVTATSGSSTATIQISVTGTSLTLSGPTSLVTGESGTYTATLTDSGGNAIVGQAITLTSANGNTLAPATVMTGQQGTASFSLTASNAGADTITASAYGGGMATKEQVSVSNQAFTITAPAANTTIDVGQANAVPVTVSWSASGAGQSGTVNLTTSRGTISPASITETAGVQGTAVTLYSTTAGPAIISATAVQSGTTVATAQTTVNFIAPVSTAFAISVQANPSTVAPQGQSTITATVVDHTLPTPNPVANATVNFTLADATGGTLSQASAVTNSAGQATVTYTASTDSSSANGVSITAEVQGTTISSSTTLTVGGQTVFLSLGTGNTLIQYSATQNELPYTVQAADSSGHGLSGVTVTFSVQSITYSMGAMLTYVSPTWYQPGTMYTAQDCPATQVYEYNGVIVSPAPNPVPTGYVLTSIPGSVATTDVSSAVTSTGGSAMVNLIYPKDHSFWVGVALTATATVSGTQNSTTATFLLPGLATDYTTQTIEPPGQYSPYGTAATCYP
jgi:Bacterial Ig-like domain (group 1)